MSIFICRQNLFGQQIASSQKQTYYKMEQSSCGQFYREWINKQRKYNPAICQICYTQFVKEQQYFFAQCAHNSFCKSCLRNHMVERLMAYKQINCPLQNCPATIDRNSHFWREVPVKIKNRYQKFKYSQQAQHDVNFRACPLGKCLGNIIFKGNIFKCTNCSSQFCLQCLCKVHQGPCDFRKSPYLKTTMNLRICPNCKYIVQKIEGCAQITCVCKFRFCYICNAPYDSNHTCKLNNVNRVIMYQPELNEIIERQDCSNLIGKWILQVAFIFAFVIPYLFLLSLLYIMRMVSPTLQLIAQFILYFVSMTLLGLGPFTIESASMFGNTKNKLLLAFYPLTAIVGIAISFKQLTPTIVSVISDNYFRKSIQIGEALFKNSLE